MAWLSLILILFTSPTWAAPDFMAAHKLIRGYQQAQKKDPALAERLKAQGQSHAETCQTCHGIDGIARKDIPHLAGQNPVYLAAKLLEFRKAPRSLLFMHVIAKELDDEAILGLALYYAGLPPPKPVLASSPQGAALYQERCQHCHGPDARGESSYPRLAGQNPLYLRKTLTRFMKNDPRRKSDTMHAILEGLGAKDLEALIAYLNHPKEDSHAR